MTTNSPNPVDGDVQALIEKEMDAFEKWFLSFRTDWDKGSLYRINYKKGPGYSSYYVQAMWKGWSAHKELTQTAQLLRPVELPGGFSPAIGDIFDRQAPVMRRDREEGSWLHKAVVTELLRSLGHEVKE